MEGAPWGRSFAPSLRLFSPRGPRIELTPLAEPFRRESLGNIRDRASGRKRGVNRTVDFDGGRSGRRCVDTHRSQDQDDLAAHRFLERGKNLARRAVQMLLVQF